jgi:TonB-linked SusC/RagA family outer membrane protein
MYGTEQEVRAVSSWFHLRVGESMKAFILSALTVALLVSPTLIEAQTITGSVRDQATGAPLASVQVFIAGIDVGVLSQGSGQYLLLNVPVGTHTVTAQLLGYREVTATVTVAAGQTVVENLVMNEQALQLDEIVVTGTASGARVREIGNSVAVLDASIADAQPIVNVTDLLRGRVAGVVIQQGSGMAGAGSAIKIRGSSTMREVSQGPLIYIDGVRVNNIMTSGTRDVSRMDDLDPGMIESMEIIKGPAAATLYGTEAANGVINIITKRGAAGTTSWNFTTRQGTAWFNDPAGHTPTNWGVNSATGQIESLNVLENQAESDLMFRNARNQYYGMDVSGGSATFQYFVAGSASLDEGATFNSWARKYNGRVNISAQPADNVTLTANMGIGLNRMRMAGDYPYEDAVRSAPNRLNLTPDRRGYDRRPPEAWLEKEQDYMEAARMTGGFSVVHTPTAWFSQKLTFGVDITDQNVTRLDALLSPQNAPFWSSRDAKGAKYVRRDGVIYSTFDYGASADRAISESIQSTTSFGFQVYTKSIEAVNASGSEFPAIGLSTISATGTNKSGGESITENNTVGVYLQQQFGWRDKLFIVGAVRADDNSSFGEEFDLVYYPKVSGSWVVSEESFWGDNFINSFRVRGAYGESGQQPDAFDALRSYTTRGSPTGGGTVTPDSPGNSALGPERGVEIEVGFDASLFNDRVSIDFSYYNQRTKDAIVARDVAPSFGFNDKQFVNIGEIQNKGIELGLNARVIETGALDWDLGVNLSTNHNEVLELGLDGFLQTGWTARQTKGYPVGSLWAPDVIFAEFLPGSEQINPDTMKCNDGNGVGVACDENAWIYQGHPDPNLEASFTTAITIGDRLTIQSLVQARMGQTKYDLQGWWRYSGRQQAKLNLLPLEHDDINEVAEAQYGSSGEFDLWVNEASFVRWKELSVSYRMPESWAQKIGASRGTVSVASRNLAMLWTNWPEWPHHDPEITDATSTYTSEPQEDAGVPPLMSLTLTVRLSL